MAAQGNDVMEVEGAVTPDLRFNEEGKINAPNGYNFVTGFGKETLTRLWKKGLVAETDDGHLIFVNFNVWATMTKDVPKLEYEKHIVFPFPWRNKHVIAELSKKQLREGINNIVALNSIPVLMYTPMLFLMLNGIRAGKLSADVPGYPRVILSTDVATCYQQVMTFLLSSQDPHITKYGRVVRKNYDENLHKLTADLQNMFETDSDYVPYGEQLKTLIKTQKLEALAFQEGDDKILARVANYAISFQMNWMHLMELLIYTLADPLIAMGETKPKDLGRDFYSQTALPTANDKMLYNDVAVQMEAALVKEQVAYLRLRAANMDAKRFVANTFSTRQTIGGISSHFLRTLVVVMTT